MRASRFAAVDDVSEEIFNEVFCDDKPVTTTPKPKNRVRTRLLSQSDQMRWDMFGHTEPFHKTQTHALVAESANLERPAGNEGVREFGHILIVNGPARGAVFCLNKGTTEIGRGDDQDIRLQFGDPHISRSAHTRITYKKSSGLIAIQSGEKNNPVLLNQRVLHGTQILRNEDLITLGLTTLCFLVADDR